MYKRQLLILLHPTIPPDLYLKGCCFPWFLPSIAACSVGPDQATCCYCCCCCCCCAFLVLWDYRGHQIRHMMCTDAGGWHTGRNCKLACLSSSISLLLSLAFTLSFSFPPYLFPLPYLIVSTPPPVFVSSLLSSLSLSFAFRRPGEGDSEGRHQGPEAEGGAQRGLRVGTGEKIRATETEKMHAYARKRADRLASEESDVFLGR